MLTTWVKSGSVNLSTGGFPKIGRLLIEQKVANSSISFQDLEIITDNYAEVWMFVCSFQT